MVYTMLNGNILIKKIKQESKTKSGIILDQSEDLKELPRAVVVSSADDSIQAGDIIVYYEENASFFSSREDLLVIRTTNVIGIEKNNDII